MVGCDKNRKIKDIVSRMIVRAIQNLPEDDRKIFILKHYKNLSAEEIAARLQTPVWEIERSLLHPSQWLLCQMNPTRREISNEG